MDEATKKRIDRMDYEAMLRIWRFAPMGHPMLQDETGDYFKEEMFRKKKEIGNDAAVAASKAVGWDRP